MAKAIQANHIVDRIASVLAVGELADIARARGVTLHVVRAMGQFVPEGGQLAVADGPLDEEACAACRDAFDLGPVRTMQDDLELGIRQIVDIALKAISPAVNDPSTAVTLVVLPAVGFARTLDLAMNQIRQYGRGDVAVLLRKTRALGDVADMTDRPQHLAAIARHAAMLRAVAASFSPDDREELDRRLGALSARLAGVAVPAAPPGKTAMSP